MADLFPRGIATGKAFYDRKEERLKLKNNIEHTVHTVLIAPRRFGKTSLMSQVLYENDYHHIWLDFMTITTVEEVQEKFIEKISALVVKLAPLESKLKTLIGKYFRKLNPEIVLSVPGISVTLHPDEEPHRGITEVLLELDKLVEEIGERVVIVLDEFQEVARIESKGTVLQAAIRHAAERSQAITYLFSGSKHRPLKKLFNGKDNPLYELCDQMVLERVSEEDYREFINAAANEKWGYELNDAIMRKIFLYTDRYPKYVNALCGALWMSDLDPSEELLDELWRRYMFSRKTDIFDDVSSLTLNQRKLLQVLSAQPTPELYSREHLQKSGMSQSSVQAAANMLMDKGLVEKLEGQFRVLDPTIRAYFEIF